MSRRLVTRVVYAPLVIAITTTVIPPASLSSQMDIWVKETLPATLAGVDASARETIDARLMETAAAVSQWRANLDQRVLESAEDVVSVRTEIASRLSAASDFISSSTDASLATVDAWMTSMSATVLAALPGAPADESALPTYHRPFGGRERPPVYTASVPAGISPFPPFIARLEIEESTQTKKAPESAPRSNPESVAIAPEAAVQPRTRAVPVPDREIAAPAPAVTPAEVEVATAPVQAPVAVEAVTPPVQPPAEVKVAALPMQPPVELKTPALPVQPPAKAEAPAPAPEKSMLASIGIAVVNAVTSPAAQTATSVPEAQPEPELKTEIKEAEVKPAAEAKPEEKQVVASLGTQPTAADAAPAAAIEPANPLDQAKAVPVPELVPYDANAPEMEASLDPLASIQMSREPISAPLKLRALTRADIPPADKFASLGSTTADSSVPPEQQRVAYDAPVTSDEPQSIGRRKWAEEANKYHGLGSPDALLEALRHMGANAKSLGLPASLWCADFMNLVLRKSGLHATGSRAARSYLKYGQKIDEPRVGAIAIFSRGKNNGHIGIVRGTDGNGNPIIVSGNHGNRVAEAVYPKSRVLAYVVPR